MNRKEEESRQTAAAGIACPKTVPAVLRNHGVGQKVHTGKW